MNSQLFKTKKRKHNKLVINGLHHPTGKGKSIRMGFVMKVSFVGVFCAFVTGLLSVSHAQPQMPQTTFSSAESVYQVFADTFSGEAAYDHVAFLMQFWRVGGGQPGFDTSLVHIQAAIEAAGFNEVPGLKASVLESPRSGNGLVWHPTGDAILKIASTDSVLHRFEETPQMLFEGTPAGEATAPLVLASNDPSTWAGKFVLAQGSVRRLLGPATANGAAGVLVDAVSRYNQPERWPHMVKYLSIGAREEGPMAFSISRHTYNALHRHLENGPVELYGRVAAETFEAPVRTLIASIEGSEQPEERIVVVAHVDEPMANDNASGTATLTEIAVAMASAIQNGDVPRPARTITFLWVEEYTSTFAYLDWLDAQSDETVDNIKAAIVLDMVGQDVSKTGGTFLIERAPDPAAIWLRPPDAHTEWGAGRITEEELNGFFINDVYRAIANRRAEDTGWIINENPWEGGSDHDPFLRRGIPALLNWHFTDMFYHSSLDLIENVSPEEMANVGITASTAAYLFAQPSADFLGEAVARLQMAASYRINWATATAQQLIEAAEDRAAALSTEQSVLEAWWRWYDQALENVLTLALPNQRADLQAHVGNVRSDVKAQYEAAAARLR